MKSETCPKCKNPKRSDRSYCLDCQRTTNKNNYRNSHPNYRPYFRAKPNFKICNICKLELPKDDQHFHFVSGNPKSYCKICWNSKQAKKQEKKLAKLSKPKPQKPPKEIPENIADNANYRLFFPKPKKKVIEKECNKCHRSLEIKHFKRLKKTYSRLCNDCNPRLIPSIYDGPKPTRRLSTTPVIQVFRNKEYESAISLTSRYNIVSTSLADLFGNNYILEGNRRWYPFGVIELLFVAAKINPEYDDIKEKERKIKLWTSRNS